MKKYIFILILIGLAGIAGLYFYFIKTEREIAPEKSLSVHPEIHKKDMTLYFSSVNTVTKNFPDIKDELGILKSSSKMPHPSG